MSAKTFQVGDKVEYQAWEGANHNYQEVWKPVTVVKLGAVRIRIRHADGSEQWADQHKLRPVDKSDPAGHVGQWLDVDGEPVHLLADPNMSAETASAMRELVRLARAEVATPLELVANKLQMSTTLLGLYIWEIAAAIEAHGNKGYAQATMEEWGENLKLELLNSQYELAWKEILFHAEGSGRSRKNWDEFQGWGVRKRPYWKLIWGDRFEWDTHRGQELIAQAWDDAHTEYEKRRARRRVERTVLGVFEDMTTQDVAYHMACFDMLARRYKQRMWNHFPVAELNAYKMLMHHYSQLTGLFHDELAYRTKSQPEQRASEKKMKAAREDFAKAAEYLKTGTAHFFSKEFVAQAVGMVEEPDLGVDVEHLPKQPNEQTPIMWQSDSVVVKEFMKFLNENPEGSFEWEDARLILSSLRKMLARAKGQPVDATSISKEAES